MTSKCANHADIYRPELATVTRSEAVTAMERFVELKLDTGRQLGHRPGQFVEVSLMGVGEAPISVSSSPTYESGFQLVVRNVGNVTRAMHALKPGDKVGVRGPFGTHFPVESEMKGKDIVFICGGIGLVPVRSAINYVMDHRRDYGQVHVLFGCKTPADRLFCDELKRWSGVDCVTCRETVDSGDSQWAGNVGVITTLMPGLQLDPHKTVAVVCGPPVMYKFVIIELAKKKIPSGQVYVSLERRMKCGVGKCGHCQINGLYACQQGPVFKYSDVENVREAI